jgi:putative transposase
VRFEFIEAHQGEFSIEAMCRCFELTRSGYYAWLKRPESARAVADRALSEHIERVFEQNQKRYGAPRISKRLRQQGRRHSKKRVARLMRERGLRASTPRKRVITTDSKHSEPIAPNRLNREFTATEPNQKWAGDITYIWTGEGWLYLAVMIDLFSRMIVGWAMSDRIDQQLTTSALLMAFEKRQPGKSLLVHSDRGVQYAASDYRRLIADWSATASMSRKGNCYDNAVSESFFATLKKELVYRQQYQTRQQARTSVFEYLEVFYNRERLHSRLGYVSPVQFEQAWIDSRTMIAVAQPPVVNPLSNRGFSTGSGAPAGLETTGPRALILNQPVSTVAG